MTEEEIIKALRHLAFAVGAIRNAIYDKVNKELLEVIDNHLNGAREILLKPKE